MDLFDKFQFNDYVKKTLNNIHFTSPTPIQDKVIPLFIRIKILLVSHRQVLVKLIHS